MLYKEKNTDKIVGKICTKDEIIKDVAGRVKKSVSRVNNLLNERPHEGFEKFIDAAIYAFIMEHGEVTTTSSGLEHINASRQDLIGFILHLMFRCDKYYYKLEEDEGLS